MHNHIDAHIYNEDTVVESLMHRKDIKKSVNDVIADKNVVTKIMSKSTGLQHIVFNSFAIRHWQTSCYPVDYGWCLGLC